MQAKKTHMGEVVNHLLCRTTVNNNEGLDSAVLVEQLTLYAY